MKWKIILYPVLIVLAMYSAQATNVLNNPNIGYAVLGSAYYSDREHFGFACMTGDEVEVGVPTGSGSLTQALSESATSHALGFELSGHARYGVVSASAAASFYQQSKSNSLSVSATWLSEYTKHKQLVNPRMNVHGEEQHINTKRWNDACGDEFVDEITYGARLMFSIKIEFSSQEQQEAFSAKFRISGPLFGVEGSLAKASQQFSRNSTVIISVIQLGGDITKLTEVFPQNADQPSATIVSPPNTDKNSDTNSPPKDTTWTFVKCTLGDFEKCAGFLGEAVKYATNTKTGFPSQLAPGAQSVWAALEYHTVEYKTAGIVSVDYPLLDQANENARKKLQQKFDKQLEYALKARTLLDAVDLGALRKKVEDEYNKVDQNIKKITTASETCYNFPLKCVSAVDEIKYEEINEAVFDLPLPATASFRIWTSENGVWSREQSVKFMNTPRITTINEFTSIEKIDSIPKEMRSKCQTEYLFKVEPIFPDDNSEQPSKPQNTPPSTIESDYVTTIRCPEPSLSLLSDKGTAAFVLLIEGSNLVSGDLFFGNKNLTEKTPIEFDRLSYKEKLGKDKNSVYLVLESTRKTPGWRDIDLESARDSLWKKDIPEGDGVFYLQATDRFDRKIPFDLEYQKWYRTLIENSDITALTDTFKYRLTKQNRWWNPDSSGTTVAGSGSWSKDETSEVSVTIPK